jgi:hypothetical protein
VESGHRRCAGDLPAVVIAEVSSHLAHLRRSAGPRGRSRISPPRGESTATAVRSDLLTNGARRDRADPATARDHGIVRRALHTAADRSDRQTGGRGGTAESESAGGRCGAAPGAPPGLRGAGRRGIRGRWMVRRGIRSRPWMGSRISGAQPRVGSRTSGGRAWVGIGTVRGRAWTGQAVGRNDLDGAAQRGTGTLGGSSRCRYPHRAHRGGSVRWPACSGCCGGAECGAAAGHRGLGTRLVP